MSTRKVLGILLMGIGGLAYFARRTVRNIKVIFDSLKVYEVRADNVVFQVSVLFYNPLFIDVKLQSLAGKIYLMGREAAVMESELNQTLYRRTQSSLAFYFKSTMEELGTALWDNIRTGDVKTLTIRFVGHLTVNDTQIPIDKIFTYDDLFGKKKKVSGVGMHAIGRDDYLKFGNNSDVVSYVKQYYEQWRDQPAEIVRNLDGKSRMEQCRYIFDYLLKHVNYVVDEPGSQYIKSPARLMADGTGDCKSMTIFICSCLHCLGIPHAMRFVNFDGGTQYTHVYPVAFDENGEMIVLDAVERDAHNLPIFNYARPFAKNKDLYYSE